MFRHFFNIMHGRLKKQKRILGFEGFPRLTNGYHIDCNDLGHSEEKDLFKVYELFSCVLNIDSDHLFTRKEGGIFYIALIYN